MFVGWNGSGPLALMVPGVFVGLPLLAARLFSWNLGRSQLLLTGCLLALSGALVFYLARILNGPIDRLSRQIREEAGTVPEDLRQRHGIYGLRMEFWGAAEFLIGLLLIACRIFGWDEGSL